MSMVTAIKLLDSQSIFQKCEDSPIINPLNFSKLIT